MAQYVANLSKLPLTDVNVTFALYAKVRLSGWPEEPQIDPNKEVKKKQLGEINKGTLLKISPE